MGRTKETVNLPSKPIPKGFKIGYVLDWLYHAKSDDRGPVDLNDFWTDDKGFSKTQAVVLDLLSQDGISKDFCHTIWLDNLFTSARLLATLKEEGFSAAGTVRTQKTAKRDLRIHNALEEATKGGEQRVGCSHSALKLEHNAQRE